MDLPIKILIVDGARTRELRRRVLRASQPAAAPMPGDDRPDAVHIAAVAASQVVGTCLVFPEPCDWRPEQPAWILRSMAVDPAWQGRGVGSALLAQALTACLDATIIWCHARETAAGFWTRAGFRSRWPGADPRRVYVEPATGLAHRDMWRLLAGGPVGVPD